MERIDVAVIGAGVTGLAAARAIAARGLSTCVLERHPRPGLDTSTHNSGVIHAGIYYPPGSLKARLCVEGRRLLYEFCAAHDVPHARCGKLIVASDDSEIAAARGAAERAARDNGVEGLELVDRAFVARARAARPRAWRRSTRPRPASSNAEELVKALLRTGAGRRRHLSARHAAASAPTPAADGIVLRTERETILAAPGRQRRRPVRRRVSRMLGGERSRSTRAAASTPS